VQSDGFAPSTDEFDGKRCDALVETNLSAAEFEALAEDGASASDPFRICVKSGVIVNADAVDEIELDKVNLEVLGSNKENPEVNRIIVLATGAGVVRFERLNIAGDGAGYAVTFGEDSVTEVEIEDSVLTDDGGNLAVIYLYNNVMRLINTQVNGVGRAINYRVEGSGVTGHLTISGGNIRFGYSNSSSGIRAVGTSQGVATLNLAGVTIRCTTSSCGNGISAGADNNAAVTINDTSGSRKILFCTENDGDMVFPLGTATGSGGVVNGTFLVGNTQNGGVVSTCP
jgi:hypothetical protein